MKPRPLLIVGDAPERIGGLSRIAKDIATLACTLPEFRVAVFGRGGSGSRHFPFVIYSFHECEQWGETKLQQVWADFAGRERGIILTIWDASRLLWFAQPRYLDGDLVAFLKSDHFERWGYFPIDSTGPGEKQSAMVTETLMGYDRVLAYTLWGKDQIEKSTGRTDIDWMPHGMDLETFQPRNKQAGRRMLHDRIHEDDILLGCVMTNQQRKDWGVAFETFRLVKQHWKNARFWCHTDTVERHWSLLALARDHDVDQDTIITMQYDDVQMSYAYSACDLTILPSCEGFGFPIVESLACGTPVIHSTYGGGAELVPRRSWLVEPTTYRLDTMYNAKRPVFRSEDWLKAILGAAENPSSAEECRRAVEHLDWSRLWPACWKKWFLGGLD